LKAIDIIIDDIVCSKCRTIIEYWKSNSDKNKCPKCGIILDRKPQQKEKKWNG